MIQIGLMIGWVLFNGDLYANSNFNGGAAAVVCRDLANQILDARLLDLYEATEIHHQKLLVSQGSFEQDYLEAAKNHFHLQSDSDWDNSDEADVKAEIENFNKSVKYTVVGEHLKWQDDKTVSAPLPTGCQYEQLATFNSETEILVDSEIWSSLSSQNQAALLTHQLEYQNDLSFAEDPSADTRITVGLTYSSGRTPMYDGLPSEHLSCFSNSILSGFSAFFSYPIIDANGLKTGTVLQFQKLSERELIVKTAARLDGIHWDLFIKDPVTGYDVSYPEVQEKGIDQKVRVPLESDQLVNSELEIDYFYHQPVQLTWFQNGEAVSTEKVEFCVKD